MKSLSFLCDLRGLCVRIELNRYRLDIRASSYGIQICLALAATPFTLCRMRLHKILLLTLALPWLASAQTVPVAEKTLSNGMKLLLVERHDEPAVAGGWVAHVGSSNEKPGMTG